MQHFKIKERRKNRSAMMKIPFTTPRCALCTIFCPDCHSSNYWRHGSYIRYFFHSFIPYERPQRKVQRYRCLNRACPRKTFTVQAPDALHYCRFLHPELLVLDQCFNEGQSSYRISRNLKIHRVTLSRLHSLLHRTHTFLNRLCCEITNGQWIEGLSAGFEMAQKAYCWITIRTLWSRAIYSFVRG